LPERRADFGRISSTALPHPDGFWSKIMIRILAVAALASAFAAPSFASTFNDGPWVAVPQTATAETGFIGEHVIWTCDATGCKSVNDTTLATALSACQAAAKELGPLTKFVADRGQISDAKLAKCNESASAASATKQASVK
jgi:hypothetical protein